MAVRTAYAGTANSGDVLTASNFNKLPGGWIGYAEATTSQGSISSETDLTSLTVTVTVGTSRRIKITGHIRADKDATAATVSARIKESTTQLQEFGRLTMAASDNATLEGSVVLTPSSGSHTYKLTLLSGAGNVQSTASSTAPAFILVEDIGPAS